MFNIKKKTTGGAIAPERVLTADERERVIARYADAVNFIYFEKGDEQKPEFLNYKSATEIPETPPIPEALDYFMKLTPEQKQLIANDLKPFLQ